MDPFTDKLDRLKARYSTEDHLPPHVVFDLLGTLHAVVHEVEVATASQWEAIAKLESRVSALEAKSLYVNPESH
jgi:hypothetical protein